MEKDKIPDNYLRQIEAFLSGKSVPEHYDTLSQEEMDELWDDILKDMDITEVWSEISSDLDILMPEYSCPGIIIKSLSAILIILIGIIPANEAVTVAGFNQPEIETDKWLLQKPADLVAESVNRDQDLGVKDLRDRTTIITSSLLKAEENETALENDKAIQKQSIPLSVNSDALSRKVATYDPIDSTLFSSPDIGLIRNTLFKDVHYPGDLRSIKTSSVVNLDRLKVKDLISASSLSPPSVDNSRISIGIVTLFKNTWLLNYETLDGLKSESLSTTEMVFYPDVGLNLDYSLNKRWKIQAEGFIFSNTGQEYLEYICGHYSRKKISLTYSTIALNVKYGFRLREIFMHNSSLNVLAGGYISVLNYASQKINANIEDAKSQYENLDLGLKAGIEIEQDLSEKLSLAPGVSFSYGIPNIYKGSNYIPGHLRKTHNGSVGLQLTLYYHFD